VAYSCSTAALLTTYERATDGVARRDNDTARGDANRRECLSGAHMRPSMRRDCRGADEDDAGRRRRRECCQPLAASVASLPSVVATSAVMRARGIIFVRAVCGSH
jgi:hypothetical protein